MNNKTEFKVGLTVFFSIIIFVVILFWAKDIRIGEDGQIIKIKFDSVAGLEIGDRVSVKGVKSGKVQNIEFVDGEAIVTANLDNGIEIYSDASYLVMMLDLMGGKKIEIDPGKSGIPVNDGQLLNGKFAGDISTAMAVLSSMEQDVISLIKSVNYTLSVLNETLDDGKITKEIKFAISNLNRAVSNVNTLVEDNKDGINSLVNNGRELTENLNKLVINNESEITTLVSSTNIVLAKTDSLISQISKIASETTAEKNNLGKILYDDKLIDTLNQSIKQINELTKLLIIQLKANGVKVDADISIF